MKKHTTLVLAVLLTMSLLTACGHQHNWAAATCLSPAMCTDCGEANGVPLEHRWTEATCTTAKTCDMCGTTIDNPLGHTWQEATCLAPKTCTVCGVTEGDLADHAWLDATCSAAKTCITCSITEGEPLVHQWENATCTAPATCFLCRLTDGDPLEHNWEEATCTAPKTCKDCKLTEGTATEHTLKKWETTRKTTCEQAGEKSTTCKVCKEKFTEDIPILEHTPGKWEVTAKAAMDTAGQRTRACTECGTVLETESYELTEEEKIQAYKDSCEKYKYKSIARDPEKYRGKQAYFKGEVIQVMDNTSVFDKLLGIKSYVLRVNVTRKGSYYKYYTDTVYVTYETTADAPNILEDDIIKMYGELDGQITYETIFGASVTIPAFTAKYIDVQ